MFQSLHSIRFFSICIVLMLVVFGSCNNMPDHAKYIPKDAVAVVGINTKQIGKKIAWNALTGSKMFDEMKDKMPFKDALKDAEQAGIKASTTFYIYMKTDKRFNSGSKVTALLPLNDADKWETYLKKTLPSAVITKGKEISEANLGYGMYAGWNKDVLVLMNTLATPQYDYETDAEDSTMPAPPAPVMDAAMMSSELANAFTTSKENAITGNKHFTQLQKDWHDISLWINYEELTTQYMDKSMKEMMGGIAFSGNITKDAAFAAGFDFEKGSIKGSMLYYTSPELKEILKGISKENTDKDLIDRLPANNLNMLAAMHISPNGTKAMLEKTGMLGLANLALSAYGMDAGYILDAFTGDMAFSINDFAWKQERAVSDTAIETGTEKDYSFNTTANYIYTLKINKKENFNKILQLAIDNQLLTKTSENTYSMAGESPDAPIITIDNQYFIVSNKQENIAAYLKGDFKNQKRNEGAKSVYGHPLGFYFDMQTMVKSIDPAMSDSPEAQAMLTESKKLLSDVSFNGGGFKGDAMEYNLTVNFMNKDENSLLQLMNFAMKMGNTTNPPLTARN